MSSSSKLTMADKAHWKKDLKYLLLPWYMHRAQITWQVTDKQGRSEKKTGTFYAIEQTVTYAQCVGGHAESILLSRLHGYMGLVDFIENSMGSKVVKAVLYQREPGSATFEKLLRRYYRKDGVLGLEGDVLEPGIDDSTVLELQYQIVNGRVVIVPPEHSEQVKEFRESLKSE